MPGVQTFNETFLPNGEVPQTGTKDGAAPPAYGGSATGTPPGLQKFDGTANLRVTTVTKHAERGNTSGGNAKSKPAGVQSFADGTV